MEVALQTLIEAAEQEWVDHWRRGPSRLRWDELPPQRGDAAPDVDLSDTNGQPTKLGELWNELPLLLIFWRHFGCGCAEGRLQRLRDEYPELLATGARIAVVGQAEPERASWYADTKSLQVQLLCDPEERCTARTVSWNAAPGYCGETPGPTPRSNGR
jgi:peroxiredoxin